MIFAQININNMCQVDINLQDINDEFAGYTYVKQ